MHKFVILRPGEYGIVYTGWRQLGNSGHLFVAFVFLNQAEQDTWHGDLNTSRLRWQIHDEDHCESV